MRAFILGFLIFSVFTIFARWYFICEVRNLCEEAPPPARLTTLTLTDGDEVILKDYEQFMFDSASIEPIMTENNRAFLQAIADYLKNNPDKKLNLKGRYLESETTAPSGIFENLGIARAAMIRHYLENLGVEAGRITIDHERVKGSILSEPIAFLSYTAEERPTDYEEFSFMNMSFSDANFEYNSATFEPGEACILYADSVQTFLDENVDFKLIITGHTDSIGSEKYNYDLGLARSKNAAEYFRELGVTTEIDIKSLGETAPIVPNTNSDGTDNEEGRQKNRRVNFKLETLDEF